MNNYKKLINTQNYYIEKQKESEEMVIAMLWLAKWLVIATLIVCVVKVVL